MDHLIEKLEELGRNAEASVVPGGLRLGTLRRIRRRQISVLMVTGVLAVGVVGGTVAALRAAIWQPGPAARSAAGSTAGPQTPSPLPEDGVSVSVGGYVRTLTTFIDTKGPGIHITGQGFLTELRLPITDDLMGNMYINPTQTSDWAMFGLVTSEASQVVLTFSDGRTLDASLYSLPPDVSTTTLAFAAQLSEVVSGMTVVVEAMDATGSVLATFEREVPSGEQPSSSPPPGP